MGLGSGIRDPGYGIRKKPDPGPGVKKAQGKVTHQKRKKNEHTGYN
jgi:hypothetical protein